MASPGDEISAGAAGRSRMRASHADREQVIEALKDAFVDGRLTRDELDGRAGRALSARTWAELAALTADIPAGAGPARPPVPARRRPLARAAIGSGGCLAVAAAAIWVFVLTDPEGHPGPSPYQSLDGLCFVVVLAAVLAALGFLVHGVAGSVKQRSSRGQRPPRPGPRGQALEVQQHGSPGRGPVPPSPRADQTCADLRSDRSSPHRSPSSGRGAQALRGIRPVPGAA